MQTQENRAPASRLILKNTRQRHLFCRSGSAAVEAALVLPLLIGITFGAIDIAQYINMSQIVTNAAREGAMLACDSRTATVQQVKDGVNSFMTAAFPTISSEDLAQGIAIQVKNSSGQAIAQGDLKTVNSGEPLSVSVSFDFSIIRWLRGPNYSSGNLKLSKSFGRRE